ncbi:MAG: hypothetical protein CME64_08330 [Halobacteriovoraceae bacterium]|nr:hypothetical protein [Halobacteriovoraceae bacterium]|tara:strand:+ start:210181 stop:211023 length:843 start_codon:yes stop_codon:yes gene_type:complete
MELIGFYLLNIVVGAILSVILGLYGAHVVARNKTIETILLGQSIQVGILLGVILGKLLHIGHNDHGLHLEIIVSILFTCLLYGGYEWVTKSKKHAKTPILVSFYTFLVSLSYLIVAISPQIESHMVKAFLGDIVTASRLELYVIMALSLIFAVYFIVKQDRIKLQSFDLSSFGHLVSSTGRADYVFFNLIVLSLMIYSIHVLGIVFTLSMMIFPITISQFTKLTLNKLYLFIALFAPSSVVLGFVMNIQFEGLPTSSLMVMSYLGFGIVLILIQKMIAKA